MDVGGAKKGIRGEINVTPLIDVVLVLLIIFMVLTPSMLKHLDPTIPKKADDWSAPSRYEEPKGSGAPADYAFEMVAPQVDELDVLEIPDETGLELYNPERAAAAMEEDVVLYEPEIYPPLEELRQEATQETGEGR